MRRLIITATLLAPATTFADSYLAPALGPRDLALAGGAVANAEGAGALSVNTAALAGSEGLDVSVAGSVINNSTEWKDSGQSAKLSEVTTPPTLAVSYGMKLPNDQALAFGVGFGAVGGGKLEYPAGWTGQETFQSVNQQIFGIGAGVAFQALPWLKFGASYLRIQATEEIHSKLNFLDHIGDAGIGLAGGGDTFGVAAEVHVPNTPLRVGVTYSHTANLDMTGHVHFTDVPPSFQTQLHDQGISRSLLVPDVVFAGLAYEVMPNLTLMAAGSFEHWSDYKEDKFVGNDKMMLPDGTTSQFTVVVPRNDDNAWAGRIAAEWKKIPSVPFLTARAAVLRSESGQNSATLAPSLTDASRWAISLGAGFEVNPNLHLSLGGQLQLFDGVTAPSLPDTFQGTYNTHVIFVSGGVDWRTDLGMARK